jgi:PAS domain S-box-containing protein
MSPQSHPNKQLTDQIADLRARLDEANETLRAIRIGEADAVLVHGPRGDQLFTLKGADEPYRVLIEEMNQGAVTLSADGSILYCNRRFADLLRTPVEGIVGLAFGAFVAPSERSRFAALLEMGRISASAGEITLCSTAASEVPLQLALGPLPACSAAAICLVATDISESRQAKEALNKSEQHFRALADAMPQIVWTARSDGFIDYYNQRWFDYTGMTHDQTLGGAREPMLHPEDVQKCIDRWTSSFTTGEPYQIEYRLKRASDGTYRWFLGRALAIRNERGQITRWFGTSTDIDDQKRAEAEILELNETLEQRVFERTTQLEAANKELEAFSYSVSHDLRAPLRAITGFTGFVLEDFSSQLPEKGRQYLERVRIGGKRMGELIDDLLRFSRLSRQPLRRQNVDTVEVVQNVLEDLKPQQDGREIDLRLAKLPWCEADPGLLTQVWINLLSNAIKYTRDRKPAIVEIGWASISGENVYFVRDNGTGFDMQYVNKLFGVFQRPHSSDEFEGTGVGLAIVQRIVHRHGGRVWAESSLDQGATFSFTLQPENKHE